MQKNIAIKTFEEFIALRSADMQARLYELWELIASALPQGYEECLSYQIPSFKYKGFLVGFGNTKTHVSFYVMSSALCKAMAEELKPYKPQTATIAFKLNEPFPKELIHKIIALRIEENVATEQLKMAKKLSKK